MKLVIEMQSLGHIMRHIIVYKNAIDNGKLIHYINMILALLFVYTYAFVKNKIG